MICNESLSTKNDIDRKYVDFLYKIAESAMLKARKRASGIQECRRKTMRESLWLASRQCLTTFRGICTE